MSSTGPVEPPKRPDGRTLLAGAKTIALFRWSAQVLSWGATLVVLRLLSPADYGIASLATAVIVIASVISDFGLGSAVVALPELDPKTTRQLHGAALLLGTGVTVLCASTAPLVARFYAEPALAQVLPVLSLIFVAEGARLVPLALLSRALAYRSSALYDFFRSILSAGLVIVLAWQGLGYWSLILGNLFGVVGTTIPLLLFHPVGLAWPRLRELREHLRLARDLVVGRVAWTLYRNSDFLVAGRLFGPNQLGHYTMAWNVASLPGEKLGNVLTAATLPFFSALQKDRAALRHYYLQVTEALALVLFPVLLGFFSVADLAVPLLLGEKWLPAVPALRALVVYACMQSVGTPVFQIMLVTGRTRVSMQAGLLSLCVLPPAFVIGGLLGGTVGIALTWVVLFPGLLAWPLHVALSEIGLRFGTFLPSLSRALECSVVMLLATLVSRMLLANAPDWLALLVTIGVGAASYAGWLWFRHGAVLHRLWGQLRGKPG